MTAQEHKNCCAQRPTPWYRQKTVLVVLILILLTGAAHFLPFLRPFRESFLMYLRMVWIPLALGLVLGGCLDYYMPKEIVSHVLARQRKRTILYSVILGFFTSLCSHGILALSVQLYKKGASTASVVAFLLASPWANFPLTLLLVGFFGVVKGLYIIIVAMVIALTTGLLYQFLERENWVERNPNTLTPAQDYSPWDDLRGRFTEYHFSRQQLSADGRGIAKGTLALADMVLWWILIGTAIASLAGAYIPQHIFARYMGPSFLGMAVTLALATVVEVCSEGSAPLAFEIFKQTGALGNSFVFLMAGVVTDYTEIGLIWYNIGRRAALFLPLLTVPQVLFYGFLANHIF